MEEQGLLSLSNHRLGLFSCGVPQAPRMLVYPSIYVLGAELDGRRFWWSIAEGTVFALCNVFGS